MTGMRRGYGWQTVAGASALFALAFWTVLHAQGGQTPRAGSRTAANPEMVKRGEYLVTATGCHDCHTPHKPGPEGPEPDMSLALSGHQAGMKHPDPPKPTGPWILAATGTLPTN